MCSESARVCMLLASFPLKANVQNMVWKYFPVFFFNQNHIRANMRAVRVKVIGFRRKWFSYIVSGLAPGAFRYTHMMRIWWCGLIRFMSIHYVGFIVCEHYFFIASMLWFACKSNAIADSLATVQQVIFLNKWMNED